MLVVGEAGVGKSLLLRELLRSVSALSVLRARGDELEQEFPFGVVRQLLEPVLRTAGDAVWDGPAELAREVFSPRAMVRVMTLPSPASRVSIGSS